MKFSRMVVVNQYVSPEGAPGISRERDMASAMAESGISTTFITGSQHYWNYTTSADGDGSDSLIQTLTIRTRPAANGMARVLGMLNFSVRAVIKGWRRDDLAYDGRVDFLMGSNPHLFAALAAYVLARRHRVPYVLEVRDIWPMSLVEVMGLSPRHPLIYVLARLERFLYRRANLIVTALPGSEQHINDVAGRACDIYYLPNGNARIDQIRYEPEPSGPPFRIAYAGAHGVPNNLDSLVAAAKLLREMGHAPPIEFHLYGEGRERARLIRRAQAMGLGNMYFHSPVGRDAILERLKAAHVAVLPAIASPLYRYGVSPNKLFDYMSAGRPVIYAMDAPYNHVLEANAGWAVPPDDAPALAAAIQTAARASRTEREQMGRNAQDFVSTHHDLRRLSIELASRLRLFLVSGN